MAEKKLKTKDMIIAAICTLLAILLVVFYFLPAFSVEHSYVPSFDDSEVLKYSAWDITRAAFTTTKDMGSNIAGLVFLKDKFGMAIMIAGLLMPIGIAFIIATAVFAYLSWFKGEKFKKFCFLFSLCGMAFTTITLIATWYVAIQLRTGVTSDIMFFKNNIKGSIAYGSFVNLIIAFVVAIVACAYNYFLDNFDDEDDEEEVEESHEENKKPVEEKLVEKNNERTTEGTKFVSAKSTKTPTKTTTRSKTTKSTSKAKTK